MKFKNYKSAVHNFAHSFQSLDYAKSEKLAFNVLVHLLINNHKPTASFDFINKTIEPEEAISKESKELLEDYLNWLPIHFRHHNCDLKKLEKLIIAISVDVTKMFEPPGMNYCKQIGVSTKTVWKAEGVNEQTIHITQEELVQNDFLQIGIPKM